MNILKRAGVTRISRGLILGGVCLFHLISLAPARGDSTSGAGYELLDAPSAMNTAEATPTRFRPTASPEANGDGGNTAATAGSDNEPPAVAQATETPEAYPDAEEAAPTLATAQPGDPTPTPEGGYPAGDDVNGTDRVGGDRAIFGTEPSRDEAATPDEAAQTEQRGLGGFVLWMGFLFGLVVFIAGVVFSVFFSTRDQRTNL